jgi:hypothetical protein
MELFIYLFIYLFIIYYLVSQSVSQSVSGHLWSETVKTDAAAYSETITIRMLHDALYQNVVIFYAVVTFNTISSICDCQHKEHGSSI